MDSTLIHTALPRQNPRPGAPTRWGAAVFRLKSWGLQCRRAWQDARSAVPLHESREPEAYPHSRAEHRSQLWVQKSPEERRLEVGKVHNLRTAARSLNGIVIPAGEVFSFWRQVGRATRGRGYVEGRQLQEGCLIPAAGGGLCQLTNALYQVALDAGCEIVERHAHSRVIPGSAAEAGRDATVAWNYIDLRFRPEVAMRLEVWLTSEELVVRLSAAEPRRVLFPVFATPAQAAAHQGSPHSCETCGVDTCFRHADRPELLQETGAIAYLLDECWPEFATYLRGTVKRADSVAVPLDGRVWGKPAYAWPASGAGQLHTATWETLIRAFKSRRLGHYGPSAWPPSWKAPKPLPAAWPAPCDRKSGGSACPRRCSPTSGGTATWAAAASTSS